MAMIYSVRELAQDGKGIGRFRFIGQSDEQSYVIDELCDCENGHATRDEAYDCPKAKSRYDQIFGRDIESLESDVQQKRRELAKAEQALADKRNGP